MLNLFAEIFERDLNKLIGELKAYPDESLIWKTADGISNSAGNLTLHLIGNLNFMIGVTLGNSGYVRDREREFSAKNISVRQMVDELNNTILVVKKTLEDLPEEGLEKEFPVPINNKISTVQFILIHLISHFGYHLGQINYHRRLLT
ncbi:MAG: DinB family protein [Ginsengibacter sp.]